MSGPDPRPAPTTVGTPGADPASRPGLCGRCRHARRLRSDRGSAFWRCGLSDSDARFPRYPRLPVLACAGHEAGDDGREAGAG